MENVGLSRADGLFRSTMVLAGLLQAWLPTPLRELRTATSTSELFCVVLRGRDTFASSGSPVSCELVVSLVGGVRFILLAVTVVQRNGQEPADRGCVGIC